MWYFKANGKDSDVALTFSKLVRMLLLLGFVSCRQFETYCSESLFETPLSIFSDEGR